MMREINKHSLVNFSNSFLKHYGVDPYHETIPEIDEVLKGHKKIVVMLFDGMGKNITRKHLKEDSFVRKHYLTTIDSTFPPTTAAATTSFLSGKYPVETCWLAWDIYFKELNRNVILFKNQDYNSEEKLGINCEKEILPYKSIIKSINEKDPSNNAMLIQRKPIMPDGPDTIEEGYSILTKVLKDNDKCFIYYYFDSPDCEMHMNGIDSDIVHNLVEKVNSFVKRITEENEDTLFFLFADHGHINVKYIDLSDDEELLSMLRFKIGGEKRNSMFFVKEGYLDKFKDLFLKKYGEHFILLSKKEIYEQELFGRGTPHERFDSALGDFIAISKDEYSILASKQFARPEFLKGHHAGGTKEEKEIDISVYNK